MNDASAAGGFEAFVINVIYLMLVAALALAFVRLARGPSLPDRVVALDLIATTVVGFTAYYAITTAHALLLDVAAGIALVSFLGTIAFARYVERRARGE